MRTCDLAASPLCLPATHINLQALQMRDSDKESTTLVASPVTRHETEHGFQSDIR